MRLFEHSDFPTLVIAAAEHFEMPPHFVEKDYYVTEALRIAQQNLVGRVTFKGGTSLSKGWRLISRFSEDIDLFVNPHVEPAMTGRHAIDRTLKGLRDAIAAHPALSYMSERSRTSGGLGREDYFGYESRIVGLPTIEPVVFVEPGIQSGDFPSEVVSLRSYVAEFIESRDLGDIADDLVPFDMQLLHYRRTYVEKLFTVHQKVTMMLETGEPLGRQARHYADIDALGRREDVRRMLRSAEYQEIKVDYDAKSRQYFKNYRPPVNLDLSQSVALFPTPEMAEALAVDYERECSNLFYGPYPSFAEVLSGLEEVREDGSEGWSLRDTLSASDESLNGQGLAPYLLVDLLEQIAAHRSAKRLVV